MIPLKQSEETCEVRLDSRTKGCLRNKERKWQRRDFRKREWYVPQPWREGSLTPGCV
jgi:hypothetical protein